MIDRTLCGDIAWFIKGRFHSYTSGVGVTKAPFVNFSVRELFDFAKAHDRLIKSHSYLTQFGLLNINLLPNHWCFDSEKNGKITERRQCAQKPPAQVFSLLARKSYLSIFVVPVKHH